MFEIGIAELKVKPVEGGALWAQHSVKRDVKSPRNQPQTLIVPLQTKQLVRATCDYKYAQSHTARKESRFNRMGISYNTCRAYLHIGGNLSVG